MALIIKDRIKEGSTSTGTGDISLAGAAATFQPFSSYLSNGDTTYYAIVHTASGVDEWEVGLGTWNTGNTLTRTTVLSGSNGSSAVNFSAGNKDVFITYPAEKAVYTDASGDIDINGGTIDGTTIGANSHTTGKFTTLQATGNVDFDGYIDMAAIAHPTHAEGRVYYDSNHKTLSYQSDISNVEHELGIEEHVRVYNNTGSTIVKGKPVYWSGNQNDVPTIALGNAAEESKYNVQGLTAGDIAPNSYGYVIVSGLVDGIDTSGLTAGQNVFMGLADGQLQNASPTYPNYPMCIGWVVKSDATDGIILVNQQNHSVNSFRVRTSAHIGDDLIIGGDLTVLGSQTIASSENVSIANAWNYFNSGDTIGALNTNFSGTGLNDASLTGHFTGPVSTTYYVRIDGVGTGTGGVDTFEWSTDNFATTVATDVDITGEDQLIHSTDNIAIKFEATTGHTLGDTWTGTAAPLAVDTGFATNRNTGSSGVGYTHMGIYYDVSTDKWTVFDEYDPEPEGTIDTSHASFNYGTLKAGTFEGALTGNVTGNLTGTATSANALATARTIGGVSFDGSANINLPGVNTTGNQDTTGNAATASALETARTIQLTGDVTGSTSFDGSGNVSINATVQDDSHSHIISNVDGLQTALDGKTTTSRTITAGNGLTGGGDLTANRTISHADTSTQASLTALTGAAVVSDVDLDTYGHVTNLSTRNMTLADLGYTGETNATADQTITAGGGLTGGGTGNVTISHSDTSSQASVNNSGATVIQDVTLDTYGHVTGLASTALTPATIGAATSAQGALADSATQPGDNISTLTNDAGYTTNVGNITGVTAGSGITGGGTSGTVTINHADTSSQASVNNSSGTVIQDITLDGFGHITGIASANLDGRYYTESEADSRFYLASNPNGYTTYTANQALDTTSNPTFNDVYVADQIIHSGDTDTYTQFHAADEWRVVTGGVERLEVNNSQITSTEPIHAPSFHGDGSNLTGVSPSSLTETGTFGAGQQVVIDTSTLASAYPTVTAYKVRTGEITIPHLEENKQWTIYNPSATSNIEVSDEGLGWTPYNTTSSSTNRITSATLLTTVVKNASNFDWNDPRAFDISPDGHWLVFWNAEYLWRGQMLKPWDFSTLQWYRTESHENLTYYNGTSLVAASGTSVILNPKGEIYSFDRGNDRMRLISTYDDNIPFTDRDWDDETTRYTPREGSSIWGPRLNEYLDNSTDIYDVCMSANGKYLYFASQADDGIFQVSLEEPYNPISQYTLVGFFSVAGQVTAQQSVTLSTDGRKMLVARYSTEQIWEYNLSTPWDIASASYSGYTKIFTDGTDIDGLKYAPNNNELFVLFRGGDKFCHYRLGSSGQSSSATPVGISTPFSRRGLGSITSIDFDKAWMQEGIDFAFSGGDDNWYVDHPYKGLRKIVRNNGGTWQYNNQSQPSGSGLSATTYGGFQSLNVEPSGANVRRIAMSGDGSFMLTSDTTKDDIIYWEMSTPFLPSTVGTPRRLHFFEEGCTAMALSGNGRWFAYVTEGEDILQIAEMTTPNDFSTVVRHSTIDVVYRQAMTNIRSMTLSYDGRVLAFGNVDESDPIFMYRRDSQEDKEWKGGAIGETYENRNMEGLAFSPDGLSLFWNDRDRDQIYEDRMRIAFDLSTLYYTGVVLSITGQETSPYEIDVKWTGSQVRLFLVGETGDGVDWWQIGDRSDYSSSESWANASTQTVTGALSQAVRTRPENRMNYCNLASVSYGKDDILDVTGGDDLQAAVMLTNYSDSYSPIFKGLTIRGEANGDTSEKVDVEVEIDASSEHAAVTVPVAGEYVIRAV